MEFARIQVSCDSEVKVTSEGNVDPAHAMKAYREQEVLVAYWLL